MKSVQVIKKVNNTELGKGATHETYVLVPQELNVSDLFEELETKYKFIDKVYSKKGGNILKMVDVITAICLLISPISLIQI